MNKQTEEQINTYVHKVCGIFKQVMLQAKEVFALIQWDQICEIAIK
jgi:hypothetical protein